MRKKHVLQWHIIHRCNLRCTHCYQEEYKSESSYEELEKIFFQYRNFCNKYDYKGHINFTGGEPFLSENLFPLLSLCEENGFTFGILTNGTLLDSDTAERLKTYSKLSFVQISIDGTKKVHDSIRGSGNFDKAFHALELLKKVKIQTMVSFTCHSGNKAELKKVIKLVRRKKIDRFWVDRLVPIGSSQENVLSTAEYREIIQILTAEHYRKSVFGSTNVQLNRAMQFQEGGNCYYRCSAGIKLLTILADGTLLPCRRLPLVIGNCNESDIITLYENSEIIRELQRDIIPDDCLSCPKAELCRGGAKCLTYAMKGDYHFKDINCYNN